MSPVVLILAIILLISILIYICKKSNLIEGIVDDGGEGDTTGDTTDDTPEGSDNNDTDGIAAATAKALQEHTTSSSGVVTMGMLTLAQHKFKQAIAKINDRIEEQENKQENDHAHVVGRLDKILLAINDK